MLSRKLALVPSVVNTGGIVLYCAPGATVNTQTTYSIVVPTGVTSIAALAIGAGGGGGGCSTNASAAAGGGGGGALSYSNAIAVTPGETLTVLVPNNSGNGTTTGSNGTAGLAAQIKRSATVLLSAAGGAGSLGRTSTTPSAGALGGQASAGVGDVKYSGGTGGTGTTSDNGGGGGSAAGYSSNGVTGGGAVYWGSGASGAGGSGGAGGTDDNVTIGGSGGGTLWYGTGPNGAGGTGGANTSFEKSGGLGSSFGGSKNIFSTALGAATANDFGTPGGGGAGAPSGNAPSYNGMRGAGGAVRILWGSGLDFGNSSSGVSTNTVRIKTYSTSSTSSITLPTVELGDTVIIVDYSENTSGVPTAVTPSGFTIRLNNAGTTNRLTTYSKQILSSTESGTVLTCANGTSKNAKFALVISGVYGASYTPLGTDITNGTGNMAVTGPFNYYYKTSTDGWARGSTVGFLFFHSSVNINPSTDMTYSDAANNSAVVTIPGPDATTYIKLLAYPQYVSNINTSVSTENIGINTYNFWTSNFF